MLGEEEERQPQPKGAAGQRGRRVARSAANFAEHRKKSDTKQILTW